MKTLGEQLESLIRQIVADELAKTQRMGELQSIAEFCKARKISKVTLWRAEKQGRIKLVRIGKRVFIDSTQFFK